MNWPRILKPTPLPKGKQYRKWKEALAAESNHQCVYCAIPENRFGGSWNFHVEHFRPKSRFGTLTHNYGNLYYACAICNVHKGDRWPGEPTRNLDSKTFIEPSIHDYNDNFKVNSLCHVKGENTAACYTVERVFLNRPQLINERRISRLRLRRIACQQSISDLVKLAGTRKSLRIQRALARTLAAVLKIQALEDSLAAERPYTPKDISRAASA